MWFMLLAFFSPVHNTLELVAVLVRINAFSFHVSYLLSKKMYFKIFFSRLFEHLIYKQRGQKGRLFYCLQVR